MFQAFKDKAIEKIKNLAPLDDLDREITSLVEQGTAPDLIAPNWGVCMALCDLVNLRSTEDPQVVGEKVLRILNRQLARGNVKSQLLTLTMLDTCVRNCPQLHPQLAASVLWRDLQSLVLDTSVNRIDAEVRDRMLGMIEDYGRYITYPPTFKEVYEGMVDQGVDFPVRSPEEQAPIEPYQPPVPVMAGQAPAPAAPASAQGSAAATGATATAAIGNMFAGLRTRVAGMAAEMRGVAGTGAVEGQPMAHGQPHAGHGHAEAHAQQAAIFEGMSEEDKAAIQAAMAELEMEDSAAREAAAIAAAADEAERQAIAASVAQQQGRPEALRVASGAPVPAAAAAAAPAPEPAPLPEDPAEALQVIANSVTLFSEMVTGVPDAEPWGVRDPVIAELADTCGRYRSKLMDLVGSLTDEAQLVAALAHNDTLSSAMARYDELLAQALSVPPTPAGLTPATDTASRVAAVTSAIGVAPGLATAASGAATAGPNFTLLDEDEEEEGASLATKRQAAEPVAAATAPAPAASPAHGADLLGDLLDLGDAAPALPPVTAAAQPAAEPVAASEPAAASTGGAAPAGDSLLDGLDVVASPPQAAGTQEAQPQEAALL